MTCSRLVILAAVCALSCPALALAAGGRPAIAIFRIQSSQPDFTIVNSADDAACAASTRARSASRIALRVRSVRATSVTCSRISSASTTARRSASSTASASCEGTQIGIYRTSNRTIEFFAQHSAFQQSDNGLFGLDVVATIDGTDNFGASPPRSSDQLFAGAGCRAVARAGQPRRALFRADLGEQLEPAAERAHRRQRHVPVRTRSALRVRPTVYVVGEYHPAHRILDPGVDHHATFGVEKRAGGHVFQINFSNNIGTTPAQIARGGFDNEDWYIGFNISRKFF